MIKNLNHYVKNWPGFINDTDCLKLNEDLKNANWSKHQFYNVNKNKPETISGDDELDIAYLNNENVDRVMKHLWNVIDYYIKSLEFKWFTGWQGYSMMRFNRYNNNQKMAEHCDHIETLFEDKKGIPILSILGILNDDFDGGELVMFEDTEIKMKKGDVIVFPSNFLFPHKVNPVTRGTRNSFVSWVW